MTEKVFSQMQAAEMGFLRRVHGVTLRDKVPSCEIRRALNVEPLLLLIERSQLGWFGHVSRMSQEKLGTQVLLATPTGKRPRGRPRTRWSDNISDLASEFAADREIFPVIGCFPRHPPKGKSVYENRRMSNFADRRLHRSQWMLQWWQWNAEDKAG